MTTDDGSGHDYQTFTATPEFALPPGAANCEGWEWCDGAWRRFFLTKAWRVGQICVTVGGEQDQSGHVSRWLDVSGDAELSSAAAYDLSRVLIEAAQLIDTLQTHANTFGPPSWRQGRPE